MSLNNFSSWFTWLNPSDFLASKELKLYVTRPLTETLHIILFTSCYTCSFCSMLMRDGYYSQVRNVDSLGALHWYAWLDNRLFTRGWAGWQKHLIFLWNRVNLKFPRFLLQWQAIQGSLLIDPVNIMPNRLRVTLLIQLLLASITSLMILWLYISLSVSDIILGVE